MPPLAPSPPPPPPFQLAWIADEDTLHEDMQQSLLAAFEGQRVTGRVLCTISERDLKYLGVKDFGTRRCVICACACSIGWC